MAASQTSIFDELIAAARGCVALVSGDRRAAVHFDFSQRGLAGSFIAALVAIVIDAYMPPLAGEADAAMSVTQVLVMSVVLIATQLAGSALFLRQIKRLDGFVPYLVADNWTKFFSTLVLGVAMLFGADGIFAFLIVGLAALVIEVNIARLIVTLSVWQIVMFLVAQALGLLVGLIFISVVFPMPAQVAAAVS